MSSAISIQAIDALLPQTQCGKCGHPGCKPYAQGIAQGEAINKCPPGGLATIDALARLLGVPVMAPEETPIPPQIAFIREAECIGCTKCIQACPVDAIVGAAKLMHTVITEECTGCELCIAPCPVDCIDLLPLPGPGAIAQRERANHFRMRFEARESRLQRDARRRQQERETRGRVTQLSPRPDMLAKANRQHDDQPDAQRKRLKIEAAMAQATFAKAEKRFGPMPTTAQQAQLSELRQAVDQAQRQLAGLQEAQPKLDEGAMKKAKIALAMRRVELKSAERGGADTTTLTRLQLALHEAERALHEFSQPPSDDQSA